METTPPPHRPSPVSSPEIRTAQPGDLVDAAQVYQAAAKALFEERLTAPNPWMSKDARAIDLQAAISALRDIADDHPDAVQVAVDDGLIVGLGAAVIRARHAHILFLFVDPSAQRKGIGKSLLDRLRQVIAEAGCEVITLTASEDRQAWRRYLAMGLHPGPPIVSMRAPSPMFPSSPVSEVLEPHPISPDRAGLLAMVGDIDDTVKGARRMADIDRWLTEDQATGVVFTQCEGGGPAGYFFISRDARTGRIGPVASLKREHFNDILQHALHAAGKIDGSRDLIWRCDLPGINQIAVAPLMKAGFTPWNLLPWFATGNVGTWDRYIFHDEDLL